MSNSILHEICICFYIREKSSSTCSFRLSISSARLITSRSSWLILGIWLLTVKLNVFTRFWKKKSMNIKILITLRLLSCSCYYYLLMFFETLGVSSFSGSACLISKYPIPKQPKTHKITICFAFALVVETNFKVLWLFSDSYVWKFSWLTKLPTECSRLHLTTAANAF